MVAALGMPPSISRHRNQSAEFEFKDKRPEHSMIIVTGGAGFIGSNLVKALNNRGERDVLVVDNLTHAAKFHNLVDCDVSDYFDKQQLLNALLGVRGSVRAIFHQGACSDTMASDGRYMMENNFKFSQALLTFAQSHRIPLIYASSAAVYGGSKQFVEQREFEHPLNVYGYSKFLFDQVVRKQLAGSPTGSIVGLRYFNVYGPRETHKARMASVAFHNYNQFRSEGKVRLFEGRGGWPDGGQTRDFIHVDDVIKVNLYFYDRAISGLPLGQPDAPVSGIFNCGTGHAQPFNDVAMTVVNSLQQRDGHAEQSLGELVEAGLIEYVPFPHALKGKYQSFTQADDSLLRTTGYTSNFATVQQGVASYVRWLFDTQPAPNTTSPTGEPMRLHRES